MPKKVLNKTGIEFDLLYDPASCITLFHNIDKMKNQLFISIVVVLKATGA
jgi:1-aminocyclopropane-1-carboxylate deaminase/D-cysteine desulfhydrase-like pyridoxal-dependent ACC family enzyme